jgi:hypothetical protein
MARLPKVVEYCMRVIQGKGRKTRASSKPVPEETQRDAGLSPRSALVVLIGVSVGILVGMASTVGAGVVAGMAAAAVANGLIRPGS